MIKMTSRLAVVALAASFAGETFASEWNVSVWGKRRAFTEHVEKLAELVSAKTNGEFTMNVSYGGLSKNKENLDGISIGSLRAYCSPERALKLADTSILQAHRSNASPDATHEDLREDARVETCDVCARVCQCIRRKEEGFV